MNLESLQENTTLINSKADAVAKFLKNCLIALQTFFPNLPAKLLQCPKACPFKGFTLVEMLVTTVVLSLFLSGAYSLFFGGQKISGKAAWLQYTVTDLRNAEQMITKAIQSTSYPSTLTPSRIFDAGGTLATPGPFAANFFVHIPFGSGKKTASTIISGGGICLYMVKSTAEKQGFGGGEDRLGELNWNVFKIEACPEKAGSGKLVLEERVASFSTLAPLYAANLSVVMSGSPVKRKQVLVRNVEWVTITPDSVSYQPSKITVTISCAYPRESTTIREGTSAAVPNVGIVEAP